MDTSRLPESLRCKLEARLAPLPAEYRQVLEARLAKLPAVQLEALLAKSSPMLDRLMNKLGTASTSGPEQGQPGRHAPAQPGVRAPIRAPLSKGHYNTTVQRGDPPMPRAVVVLAALLGFVALAWHLGWLSG